MAAQLADGIIKLQDFWISVQDAPKDVCEIIDDLRCLASLLQEVADGQNHSPSIAVGLKCCESKVKVRLTARS